MKGVNFTVDDYEDVIKLISNLYMESDSWDFEVVITKEKNSYDVWIGAKDE